MASWKTAAGLGLGIALSVAACGGGAPAGPGDDPGGGNQPPPGDPGATPMRSVVVNQDSDEQSYPLAGGRYRMAWRSTRDDCPEGMAISINKVDVLPAQPHPSPFEYSNEPDAPAFNTLLRMSPGLYTLEQTDASCATWEIRIDRVGN